MFAVYFNVQLNHSTTATFWGQKKVAFWRGGRFGEVGV